MRPCRGPARRRALARAVRGVALVGVLVSGVAACDSVIVRGEAGSREGVEDLEVGIAF